MAHCSVVLQPCDWCASCWRQQMALRMDRRLVHAGGLSWKLQDLSQHGNLQLLLELVGQAGNGKSWCSAAACGRFLVVNAELAVAGGGGGGRATAASSHLACLPSVQSLTQLRSFKNHLLRGRGAFLPPAGRWNIATCEHPAAAL